MHGTQRLRSEVPHLFDAGTVYAALRAVTIGGVQLRPGDLLPTDSPVRQDPTRLNVLCRNRILVVVHTSTQPSTGEVAAHSEEAAVEESEKLDLSSMTGPQLVRACRDRGLPAWGNKDVLRQRLRKAMG